jgi:Glycosyl transferases group 1
MPAAELSARQVVVGPNMPDKRSSMGRVMSIKTPMQYDLAKLIASLPNEQKPDLVVVLIDSSRNSLPANLKNVNCRKVLYIADTHHGSVPLCCTLDYMTQEKFDRYAIAHDPHHLHWFVEAGIAPLSIQLNLSARDIARPIFPNSREPTILFVGQIAHVHTWRSRLLERLKIENLSLNLQRLPASYAAKYYDTHQLSLNTSNGDWTMRFFEVLSGGGCLLTDRISQSTGYGEYFRDGEDLIFYDNENDLIEKAKYYLARPDLCLAIARSGHAKYKEHFSEDKRKQRFLEFAFSSDTDAETSASRSRSADPRCASFTPADTALLTHRVLAYEQMQELQRFNDVREVVLSAQTPEIFASDLSDLMRLKITRDIAQPDQSCYIVQEHEVDALLQNSNVQMPKYIYIAQTTPIAKSTQSNLKNWGYETPQDLMTTHEGIFRRRIMV